jgi:predicted ArsR family transcriptional regulator
MDSFDERILTSLKNSNSLNFKQLLSAVEFSHNTLRAHIAQLIRQGMIVETKKTKNGPERPILVYSLPPEIKRRVALTLTDPYTTIVNVTFQKLKHICRFEKCGYCKETRRNCGAQNCPQTIKGK